MCFFIKIEIPDFPKSNAGKLTKEAESIGLLTISAIRRDKTEKGALFYINSGSNNCACGLSTASDEEEYFDIKNDSKEPIIKLLRFFMDRSGKSGIIFHPYYLGRQNQSLFIKKLSKCTFTDFEYLINHKQLRNNTEYQINI